MPNNLIDLPGTMSEICRICLRKDLCLINIFSSCSSEKPDTATLIYTFGNTQVLENDGLPNHICKPCQGNLVNCLKLRLLIQQSYETLCLILKNDQENKEYDLPLASFVSPFESNASTHTELLMPVKKEEPEEEYITEFLQDDDQDYNAEGSEEYVPEKTKSSKRHLKKGISKRLGTRKKHKKKDGDKKKSGIREMVDNIILPKKPREKVKPKSADNNDKLTAALQKRLENRDKCPLCFEKLKDSETMADHFYSHYNNSNLTPLIVNGTKTSTCNLCNRDYKFNSMIPHHRKHLKLYPFKCEIEGCTKAFASTMNLGWHLDNHNGVKKYQCQTCGKTFHLSGSLRNHEETHIIERAQCKICHKTYKNHIMLKLHMKRHIYGQRHKCEEPGCDKAFYSAQELRRHSHTHYGSKTFVCDVCSKPWYTEKELIRHKKYHDPVKAHQCSECMKTFVDKSQLRCHEMTHRGERPHVCEFCSTGFITKSKLKRHQMKSCKGAKHYQIL